MANSRFVQVTDKKLYEIKINSIPKNTKDAAKFDPGVKVSRYIYFTFSINSVLQQRK